MYIFSSFFSITFLFCQLKEGINEEFDDTLPKLGVVNLENVLKHTDFVERWWCLLWTKAFTPLLQRGHYSQNPRFCWVIQEGNQPSSVWSTYLSQIYYFVLKQVCVILYSLSNTFSFFYRHLTKSFMSKRQFHSKPYLVFWKHGWTCQTKCAYSHPCSWCCELTTCWFFVCGLLSAQQTSIRLRRRL